MKIIKTKYYLLFSIRMVLGAVFFISGIGKIIDGSEAKNTIELMVSDSLLFLNYVSSSVMVISILEIILATLLIWGRYLRTTLSLSLLILIGFTSGLGYLFFHGTNIENCGCFGSLEIGYGMNLSGGLEMTLLKNFILLALVIGAYLLTTTKAATE